MAKPELEFHHPSGEWARPAGAVEGVWQQDLSTDPGTGDMTVLQRYDPGTDTSPNGVIQHEFWEEVYLLSGDLTDLTLGTTFGPGTYACRPPGMLHGPYRSTGGVQMIVWIRSA
jgi:ChrR Cupin-like domain